MFRGCPSFRPTRAAAILAAWVVLAVAGCGSAASPTASPSVGPARVVSSPTSAVGSTGPSASAGPTGQSDAIGGAASKLADISSYRFRIAVSGKSLGVGSGGTIVMTGTVILKPTRALHFELSGVTPGSSAGSMSMTLVGDQAWLDLGTGRPMEVPADQMSSMSSTFDSFRPETLFGSTFNNYGTDFHAVGTETKNGVACTHYQADQKVLATFATVYGVQGTWSADVWLARDGGYPVSTVVSGKAAGASASGGDFLLSMDITNIDDASNTVSPPA